MGPRLKKVELCTIPHRAFMALNFTYLAFYPSIRLHCVRHRQSFAFYKQSVLPHSKHNLYPVQTRLDIRVTPPIILQIVSGVVTTTRLGHVACKTNIQVLYANTTLTVSGVLKYFLKEKDSKVTENNLL